MDYSQTADRHWATYLPAARASLVDPEAFFRALGERAEYEVRRLTDEILAKEGSESDELERGRIADRARRKAEEIVLAEVVFLAPEPGSEDNELPLGRAGAD